MKYKGREIVGIGHEHIVLRSRQNPGYCLKIPWFFNRLKGETARLEVQQSIKRTANSGVLTPETRLFIPDKRYVIYQKVVKNDPAFDTGSYLDNLDDKLFSNKYAVAKKNFAAEGGNVYWFDLTYGFSRYFIKLGLTPEQYYSISAKFRRFLKHRFFILHHRFL